MEAIEIEVNITDYILTPTSCSLLVENLVKSLLYQKTQIPYTYNWLASTIKRRRYRQEHTESEKPTGSNQFKIENQYRIASKLYDCLEDLVKGLSKELSTSSVNEILIIFGPTPLCPKEVCRIKLPSLATGHFEEIHKTEALKYQHNALRQIFMSDSWMDSIDSSIPCTNTFIFMTKYQDDNSENSLFQPCTPLTFQKNVKQYTVKINWDSSQDQHCCKIFDEFNESCECENVDTSIEQLEHNILWYKFNHKLEGYKNVYINGKGVCDLW